MSPAATLSDEAMLARLAELDLAAAERAHARFLAADDERADAAGRTYQRMARSLRQTVALKARTAREAEAAARAARQDAEADAALNPPPDPEDAPPRRLFPVDVEAANRRTAEMRDAVRRVIWSEGFEKSEVEDEQRLEGFCYRQLEDWLVEERCEPDFTTRPLDEYVAELCAELQLNPDNAARWRELPEPEDAVIQTYLDDISEYPVRPRWKGSG
ncbi:hypothetical protein [Phenylobacterium sp.]|uniref:hypothetical protein n=1 Tax=Phenylobacterium sp. TaxID=1871053 RepID=UPI0025E79794|nr:hypothetical protein [Phenylobacterium sp.]